MIGLSHRECRSLKGMRVMVGARGKIEFERETVTEENPAER